MNTDIDYLCDLSSRGGPRPEDDAELDAAFDRIELNVSNGEAKEGFDAVREVLPFTLDTMQGFAYLKPNGYAGCFEIIERIYRRHHASHPNRFNWDRYWQSRPAAEAVRNRKAYFIDLVLRAATADRQISVLNVASGPCRDVYELFETRPDLPAHIHCVDRDAQAVAHATQLCAPVDHRVTIQHGNALRLRGPQRFDIVWSAGLFDYLDDETFKRLARRLLALVSPGGELVVGNFSPKNPNRSYMHVMDWQLFHRTPNQLLGLASQFAVGDAPPTVDAEPHHVNLFLRVPVPETSRVNWASDDSD